MKKLASRVFIALLVLATVPSVNCHFDTSTFLAVPVDVSEYKGCYEEANDELVVVLNLGLPDNTINDGTIASNQLLGCLTFAKNGQPFVGPFPLIGEAINNTTAKMKAAVPPADEIEVVLTRNVQDGVDSISIGFPGGPPMENIPRELPDYVEDTMCPTQCP